MDRKYGVMVIGMRGEKVPIGLCDTEEQMKSMTVLQLKEKIVQKLPYTTRLDHLRLVFIDTILEDDSSFLYEYGIRHESIIHMVLKLRGGGCPPGDGGMGDKDDKHRMSMERLHRM